ncbi:hypothetical protein CBF70_01785, partial [Lactobacillus taiwanensis]
SKYGIHRKYTKKNQRKIEDLSKQYSLNSERLTNKFDHSPQKKTCLKQKCIDKPFCRETNKKLLAKKHAIQSRNLER